MTIPRRIVTGHDQNGRSVVISDGPTPSSRTNPEDGAAFHELWNTAGAPVQIGPIEAVEPTTRPLRVPPDPMGTIVRIVDLPPGARSPMHRTETIDYGIVLAGEVHVVLGDDSVTRLSAGDVVVQRGTEHAWHNRSGEIARMAFILVDGAFDDQLRSILPAAALTGLYDRELGHR